MLLAGCAGLLPQLPEPATPEARRARVLPRETTCRLDRCASSVAVGERRVRIESNHRELSLEELFGGRRPSILRRAARGLGEAALERAGVVTTTSRVAVGQRTVTEPGNPLRLTCEQAWVDEETREKQGREVESTTRRLGEGLDCRAHEATAATDSTGAGARWRFSLGVPPSGDGLAAAVDSVLRQGTPVSADVPMQLERVPAGGGTSVPYLVQRDEASVRASYVVTTWRWAVRRADGTAIGALVRGPFVVDAVDLLPSATEEEGAMLRLLAACLALRLGGDD